MTYRRVRQRALRVGQLVLLFEAVLRGVNYLITPPEVETVTMTQAELTMPLWVWGSLCLFLGLLGIVGEVILSRRPNARVGWMPDVAHSSLVLMFIVLAFSAGAGVFDRTPVYGINAPFDLVAFAVAHWVFASRDRRPTRG